MYTRDEQGVYRPATPEEVIAHAKRIIASRFRKGAAIEKPEAASDFLISQLSHEEREVFGVVFLDTRHRVICFEVLFQGSIDSSTIHPREVVRRALQLNAGAVILSHNHPSGNPEPSAADAAITQRIKEVLAILDVRVLDHIVVGGAETVSLAARGLC